MGITVRSEGGAECRQSQANAQALQAAQAQQVNTAENLKAEPNTGENHEDADRRSVGAGGHPVEDGAAMASKS